ncbi:hypothetical protein [Bacillus sp. NPDC093026]|uniref:hypothetical protein n=1 Tax=Bacillus sp. NPDC093026 TaxID=3363948 RepID=UPI0037F82042
MEIKQNRYSQIVEHIFLSRYIDGAEYIEFKRDEFIETAKSLNIALPKNLGDVIYSFKFRTPLPKAIVDRAPNGKEWVIKNVGRAKYAFVAVKESRIIPDDMMMKIKIPDATPSIVQKHALSDEQALLTKVRYNRLIDVFSGVTCYSLQNHLRTTVQGIGQVETDELYVGVDKNGKHYVFPVQAKGGTDEIGVVQIEQDIALCREKYSDLICKAIATQFISDDVIAIFEFTLVDGDIRKVKEKHYQLVSHENISLDEIRKYNELVE